MQEKVFLNSICKPKPFSCYGRIKFYKKYILGIFLRGISFLAVDKQKCVEVSEL